MTVIELNRPQFEEVEEEDEDIDIMALTETLGQDSQETVAETNGLLGNSETAAITDDYYNTANQGLFESSYSESKDYSSVMPTEETYIFKDEKTVKGPEKVSALPKIKNMKWILLGFGLLVLLAVSAFMVYQIYAMNNTAYILSPTYSVLGGEYSSPQAVEIQTSGDGLTVYYTTDGSDPTVSSTKYVEGEEIQIKSDTTLKSIAVDSKGNESDISSVTYKIKTETADKTSTGKKDNQQEEVVDVPVVTPPATTNQTPDSSAPFSLTAQLNDNWPFTDQKMLSLFTASASSTLSNDGSITYYPSNVLDNDSKTAWIEDISGVGTGERISLTYEGSDPYTVNSIYFLDGYTKTAEIFNLNTTPTALQVSKNGANLGTITLKATPQPQYVVLPTPIVLNKGDSISFTIQSTSVGPNDDKLDTAISEIRLN